VGLPVDTTIAIKAFVWMGNESDTTVDQATANLVQRELQMWFEAMRDVTRRHMARGITSVILNASPNGAFTSTVRAAQRYVGLLPRNGYADQAALTYDATTQHLTTASVVQHGADLYRAFKAAETLAIPYGGRARKRPR
jgi:hypothetical protein